MLLSGGGRKGGVDLLATLSNGERPGVRIYIQSVERDDIRILSSAPPQ